jgi:hypothetical protein
VSDANYLRLLVECTHLKRFAINAPLVSFEKNPLFTLKQEKWGCRDLEELDLHFGFILIHVDHSGKDKQDLISMAFAAGWEMVPSSCQRSWLNVSHLPKVFELLAFQELEKLQCLTLIGIPFRRVT